MNITLGNIGINSRRGGGFSPNSLFAAGESGDWIDPSDLSKIWQDTAGTTPVTADGQSVQRIDGQRGIISLRNATNPPLYKTSGGLHWLQFDGTNDGLASNATLDLTGTDEVTVCVGVRKSNDLAGGRRVIELSADAGTTNGSLLVTAPDSVAANYGFYLRGTAVAGYRATTFAAGTTNVLTVNYNISGATLADNIAPRVNGQVPTLTSSAAGPAGSGNFGNHTVNVGSRAGTGFYFAGNVYFLLIRGALTSGAQLTNLERLCGQKSGVTI